MLSLLGVQGTQAFTPEQILNTWALPGRSGLLLGVGVRVGKGRGPTWRHSKGAGRKGKTHLVELNYGLDLLSQSQAGKVTLGEHPSQQDVIGFNV